MARKARVEIEGGLYHVITRGNDRQTIFHSSEDYAKFLSLLSLLKGRLPFYLYAKCLMSNHVHLLIGFKHRDYAGLTSDLPIYATVTELSEITGLKSSNVSRRYDAAISRRRPQADLYDPVDQIIEAYKQIKDSSIAITQA